jgi:2-hydroxy-6-oxonona-2,4-dienedioate hydrolase
MKEQVITSGKFKYLEVGSGKPIVILHGLMGSLSNFQGVTDYFPKEGYKVIIPMLPIYDLPLLKTNVKQFAQYVNSFIDHLELTDAILLGNSLGGHIGLLVSLLFPEKIKGLIITGSSGLYENSMGESYPKREDRGYMTRKCQEVFYDPKKLIKILAIAKSAIRHNMAKDLPKIQVPTAIIWGENDIVTPPDVGHDFNRLLPNSNLYWIENCGHAPMMEHPDLFNDLMVKWLASTFN